jgi:hypothetical protein
MLRAISAAVVVCLYSLTAGAQAPASSSSELKTPRQASPLMQTVYLRGTLGDAQVQVSLRPKADVEDSIEGEYFLFGSSQKVLLAGEIEGNELFLEESENGTDVSGQWNGTLNGDIVSGNWQSADGAVTRPFSLKIVHAGEQARP